MSPNRVDPPTTSCAADASSPVLAAVIDAAMDAIVVLDEAQRIIRFNPAAERMFGCPASDALGQPLDHFLPEHVRARHQRHVAAFAATGNTSRAMGYLQPLTGRRVDGTEFPIEATIARVSVDGGLVAAIVRDITAREAADAARRAEHADAAAAQATATTAARERDRLQILLDRLPSGVQLVRAPDGAVGFANAAFRAMVFGPDAQAGPTPVYGRDFAFRRADGAPVASDERLGLRALRGERIAHLPLLLERGDGALLPVAVHAAPVPTDPDQPAEAIVVVQDATVLRQAAQLKDALVHDVKNPLTAVKGQAQLLQRQLRRGRADPARQEAGLQAITVGVDQAIGLIDEFLDAVRLQSGEPLELRREPLDLVALAQAAAAAAQAAAERHTLRVEAATPALVGTWDAVRLRRVLDNLLSNAIKYSPGGGEIIVGVAAEDVLNATSRAVVTVADSGIGIPATDLPHVFEPWKRASNAVGRIAGYGIGLSGVKQIVEQDGGTITVVSRDGEGSVFTVRLPRAPDADGSAPLSGALVTTPL